jgi:hypothetical protein
MAKCALSRSLAQEISRYRAEEYVRLFTQYLRAPSSDHPEMLHIMKGVLTQVPNRALFSAEIVDVVSGPILISESTKTILSSEDTERMRWLLRHQKREIKHLNQARATA